MSASAQAELVKQYCTGCHNDRGKAEGMFRMVLQKKPKEFWHWVNAGGSYLGVKPQ